MNSFINLDMRYLWAAVVLVTAAAANAEEAVCWRAAPGGRYVAAVGERNLAVYQATPNPFKPYLLRLFTPDGRQIIRDQVADHLHHHGLMFALSVDGVSYWEERSDSGKQEVVKSTVSNDGTLSQTLRWVDSHGKDQLREARLIHLHFADDVTLLTWGSTLSIAGQGNSAVLTGHHYYGLGMRFIESLDQTSTFGNAANSPGEIVRGSEKLARGNWVSCTGPVDDRIVTVVMFDHPDNPRHPAWWFTMDKPFAYQSATLNLWKQPLTLQRGQSLKLIYGVALLDGETSRYRVDALYHRWKDQTSRLEEAMTKQDYGENARPFRD